MGNNSKRKREEKKKTEKDGGSRSARFEELRDDLFREVAELVAEDPSIRIAVGFAPPASEPDGSVHFFGNPSGESVARAFLEDNRVVPVPEAAKEEEEEEEEEGDDDVEAKENVMGPFWWEDPKLLESSDPEELQAMVQSISLLQDRLRLHVKGIEKGQGSGNKDNDKPGPKH